MKKVARKAKAPKRINNVKFPDIHIQLIGGDSNAFSLLAEVIKALRSHSVPEEVITQFKTEATAGPYDHLLQTIMRWVIVK